MLLGEGSVGTTENERHHGKYDVCDSAHASTDQNSRFISRVVGAADDSSPNAYSYEARTCARQSRSKSDNTCRKSARIMTLCDAILMDFLAPARGVPPTEKA